jgi:hypothetical protein
LALVSGWRARWAAYGNAALLMIFALAMASGDPKSPFDYSVFTASMGALLLGCIDDLKERTIETKIQCEPTSAQEL